MRKFYTAEAVTEGHPDKLCDQIADAILDVCLKQDEQSRVACEVLATKGTIIVAGEITSTYEPDVFAVVRKVLSDVGYSSEGIAMDTFVHRQSPDIAGAVDTSKERREGVSDNQIGNIFHQIRKSYILKSWKSNLQWHSQSNSYLTAWKMNNCCRFFWNRIRKPCRFYC